MSLLPFEIMYVLFMTLVTFYLFPRLFNLFPLKTVWLTLSAMTGRCFTSQPNKQVQPPEKDNYLTFTEHVSFKWPSPFFRSVCACQTKPDANQIVWFSHIMMTPICFQCLMSVLIFFFWSVLLLSLFLFIYFILCSPPPSIEQSLLRRFLFIVAPCYIFRRFEHFKHCTKIHVFISPIRCHFFLSNLFSFY